MVGESGTTLVCGPQRLSRRELLAIHTRTHALHTHTTRTRCCDGRAGLRSERDLRLTRTHTQPNTRDWHDANNTTRHAVKLPRQARLKDTTKRRTTQRRVKEARGRVLRVRQGMEVGGGLARARERRSGERRRGERRSKREGERPRPQRLRRAEQEGGEAGSQRSGLPCGRGCVALSVLPPLALLVAAAAETDHFPRAKPTRGLSHLPM